jgi:hypothetical protein
MTLQGKVNVMVKVIHPRTCDEDQEGKLMYSYTFTLTSALDWGWSTPCHGHITPGKTRYPLYRRLGGL